MHRPRVNALASRQPIDRSLAHDTRQAVSPHMEVSVFDLQAKMLYIVHARVDMVCVDMQGLRAQALSVALHYVAITSVL